MTTKSNDGTILYRDEYPLEECQICREEHTDIREIISASIQMAICVYCAFARRLQYQPREQIGCG